MLSVSNCESIKYMYVDDDDVQGPALYNYTILERIKLVKTVDKCL